MERRVGSGSVRKETTRTKKKRRRERKEACGPPPLPPSLGPSVPPSLTLIASFSAASLIPTTLPKPNCSKKSCRALSADASREDGEEEEEEEEESRRRRLPVVGLERMEGKKRLLLILLLLPRKDEAQTWHELHDLLLLVLLQLLLGLLLLLLLLLVEEIAGRPKESLPDDTALTAPAATVLVAAARILEALGPVEWKGVSSPGWWKGSGEAKKESLCCDVALEQKLRRRQLHRSLALRGWLLIRQTLYHISLTPFAGKQYEQANRQGQRTTEPPAPSQGSQGASRRAARPMPGCLAASS